MKNKEIVLITFGFIFIIQGIIFYLFYPLNLNQIGIPITLVGIALLIYCKYIK